MRCIPGRHLVRVATRHIISHEYYQAYKQCCLRKGNENDTTEIDQEVRICATCWMLIIEEINNPTELAFDVMRDNVFRYQIPVLHPGQCFLCGKANPLYGIPFSCRVDYFIKTGLFLPDGTKCCRDHVSLRETEFKIDVHFLLVQSEEGIARMQPDETSMWFSALRSAAGTMDKVSTQNRIMSLDDEDFRQIVGVHKNQFRVMCDVTDGYKSRRMTCRPLSIMLLMMKLRNCQYLLFLKSLCGFSDKRTVSAHIRVARLALKERFVPQYLGPQAHPRPGCLHHLNDLAKLLHLGADNEENSILVVDGTYVYVPKSSNFTVLKRSFSVHKGRHLLKMTMIVFPDGCIFDVHGPYLSDGKNNDASTLKHDLQKNISGLADWLIPGDVLVVDRGYRDSTQFLRSLGYNVAIPYCSPKNQKQHPSNEANASRVVTKTRWVVEARNGHVFQVFKYFGRPIHAGSVPFIGDYFRICCAVLNAFYPTIQLSERSMGVGRRMIELRDTRNILMEYLESKDLINRRKTLPWRSMEEVELEDFPKLVEDDLYGLTLGVFQLLLAPGYVASQDFLFQVYREEMDLLRVRIQSRHSSAIYYYVFIRFKPNVNGSEGIVGYYCDCKQGARTVGMCSHTCAVLWYLGFARYEINIPAPSNRILETVLDAAERFGNVQVVDDEDAVAGPSRT